VSSDATPSRAARIAGVSAGPFPRLGLRRERGLALGLELRGRPEVRRGLEVGVLHERRPRGRLEALDVAGRLPGGEVARLLDDELGPERLQLRPLGKVRGVVDERGDGLTDRRPRIVRGRRAHLAVRTHLGNRLRLRPHLAPEVFRSSDHDVGLAALRERAAQARQREELVGLLYALVERRLELVGGCLEVRVALRPEELDEPVGLLVGRDLLPFLLLGVRREERELGGLAPVLVTLEAGAGARKYGKKNDGHGNGATGDFHLDPWNTAKTSA
jgi:hypothetical protein